MKLLHTIKKSTEALTYAGIEDAPIEAEILVTQASGIDRLSAYRDNPSLSTDIAAKIESFVQRRIQGEPLQYILGKVSFLDLTLKIRKGVLIPRPETELLAEEAIRTINNISSRIPGKSPITVLDLCSGSGCITLSIASAFPAISVFGTDISGSAITCARENAQVNTISNAVFLQGSLFDPLDRETTFDMIVSNPPYINSSDIPGLQREVRDWEPHEALDGGADGLDFYRRIFPEAVIRLKKGGLLLVEIGFGQSEDIVHIAESLGFTTEKIIRDLAGIDRVLKFTLLSKD